LRSPAADILVTALALHRAPGERFRLREKPLPAGLVGALEIAAGSPHALQAMAAEIGESEQDVLEAARFYLEQVLFAAPNADAYRVLGLEPDATSEAIRTHHRWLQRWLHPDRAQAGDASIFATRVNQAFAQLRTPEARHAYDVRLAEARLAGASAPLPPETVRHWAHDEAMPRYGRRSRWLLLVAVASCIVLAVLLVRNPDGTAHWNPEEGGQALHARGDPGPAIEDRDLGVLGAALSMASSQQQEDARGESPAAAVPPVSAPAPARPANPLRALIAATLAPLRAVHESQPSVVSAAPPVASRRNPAERDPAPAMALVPAPERIPAPGVSAAPDGPSSAVRPDAPLPVAQPVADSKPAAPSAPAAMPAADAALVAARLPLAEQRVAQLAGYLAARPGAVPLWDNVQAMTETNQARQRLNARKGSRLELGRPAWRMRPEQANLSADYRCRSEGSTPCLGRLEVTLVWREGLWLVHGVSLGPSA
jgi:hypothetical protein